MMTLDGARAIPTIPADSPSPAVLRAALRAMGEAEPLAVRVAGRCMEPSLGDGEIVCVRPARRYWPGNVVAFQGYDGRLTVHRVLGWAPANLRRPWRAWALWTQADRTSNPDRPVMPERILGRVVVASQSPAGAIAAAIRASARLLQHLGGRLLAFLGRPSRRRAAQA